MEEERRIQPSKPGPSAKVYNFAIGACKKMGKFPLAVGLVKKMRDSNVQIRIEIGGDGRGGIGREEIVKERGDMYRIKRACYEM
eukprot:563351-Amorphochlora_amoeboformis.AAC.1